MRNTFIFALLLFAATVNGQTVKRDSTGNWVAQPDTIKIATKYQYICKDGSFPVYQTSKGAYYVERVSKTGTPYRKYLKP